MSLDTLSRIQVHQIVPFLLILFIKDMFLPGLIKCYFFVDDHS